MSDITDSPDLSYDPGYVDIDVDEIADPSAQAAFDAIDNSDDDDSDDDDDD